VQIRLKSVFVFFICSLLICFGDAQAQVDEPPSSINMKCTEVIAQWAFDPETRRVFGNPRSGTKIYEYSSETGEEVRRFQIDSFTKEMLLKPGKLFVCSQDGLQVIDLKTNEVNLVTQDQDRVWAITTPSAESNRVYFFSGKNPRDLVTLNTETLEIESRQAWKPQARCATPRRFVVTPDERHLLSVGSANPRQTTPHKAKMFALRSDTLDLRYERDLRIPSMPVSTAYQGVRWLAGNSVMSQDLKHNVRKYKGDYVEFDERRDLYATVAMESRSSPMQDILLDNTLDKRRMGRKLDSDLVFPTVQFDKSGNYLLCAYASNCHVVNLRQFGISEQQGSLSLSPIKKTQYPAGFPLAIDLVVSKTHDGKAPNLTLIDGPTELELKDNHLFWTPTFSDLGSHSVRVRIDADGEIAEQLFSLSIVVPEVLLPLISQVAITDEVGDYAAVFGKPKEKVHNPSSKIYGPPSQVVVIDLNEQKVLSKSAVEDFPQEMLIAGKHLFWIPKSTAVLKRLSLENGSEVELLDLPTGELEDMFLLGKDQLVVVAADTREKTINLIVYDCQDWKEVKDHSLSKLTLRWWPRSTRDNIFRLGDSQLYLYGRILNESNSQSDRQK